MAGAAVPLLVGSTILSSLGSLSAGRAAATAGTEQQQAENYQAGELRTQAGQVMASGERQQQNDLLSGKLAISSANATAGAAGGGGADTDPGVAGLESQIAGRSTYNALSDLYSSEEQAAGLTTQANLDVYQGQQYQQAGQLQQSADQVQALTGAVGGLGKAIAIGALPTSGATAAAAAPSVFGPTNLFGVPTSLLKGVPTLQTNYG